MARKKKVIDTTGLPDYKIETFARALMPTILADFQNPKIQKEFQEWLKTKKNAKGILSQIYEIVTFVKQNIFL